MVEKVKVKCEGQKSLENLLVFHRNLVLYCQKLKKCFFFLYQQKPKGFAYLL